MADKKISQFDETLNPTLTAFLPIVDEGSNKRIALTTILAQASATAAGLVQGNATTIASVSALLAGDVASVNSRVDSVLSNIDPATLDSFTEVVGAFQSADSSLNGAITSLASSASTSLASVSATLKTQIDGKAASSHTHSTSDITDLQSSLTTAVAQASAASKAYTEAYAGGMVTLVTSNSASWVEPARNFDLVGSASYCGVAVAGSANASSVWKITKVTFALDGSVASTGCLLYTSDAADE